MFADRRAIAFVVVHRIDDNSARYLLRQRGIPTRCAAELELRPPCWRDGVRPLPSWRAVLQPVRSFSFARRRSLGKCLAFDAGPHMLPRAPFRLRR
jgi:hypothetical protein